MSQRRVYAVIKRSYIKSRRRSGLRHIRIWPGCSYEPSPVLFWLSRCCCAHIYIVLSYLVFGVFTHKLRGILTACLFLFCSNYWQRPSKNFLASTDWEMVAHSVAEETTSIVAALKPLVCLLAVRIIGDHKCVLVLLASLVGNDKRSGVGASIGHFRHTVFL